MTNAAAPAPLPQPELAPREDLSPLVGPNDPRITHAAVESNGVLLHVAQAGPTGGPLVLLLHGFPAFWYDWRCQIPALAAAGYRVWAPDQRGYNSSDKPHPVRAYNLNSLADDAAGLITAAGAQRATVIGHDWGAAVAWWMAQRHPQLLERVAILNTPHPRLLLRKIVTSLRQARRSTYILYFQLPGIAEAALGARDGLVLAENIKRTARRGVFSDAELEHYREAWRQPGALRAMLNWYRAVARFLPPAQSIRIQPRVQVIWGRRDFALEADLAQESVALCDDGRLTYLASAGHWVHLEEPDEVNRLLLDFLAEPVAVQAAPAGVGAIAAQP